ncbi:aspartyl-tRNA(Asn)/glutamyl-tRNA(Gln) amidotransferase subunit A [Azospirillum fermentarium]|uniref:amidase n=1 Tax=Azospirillum fermentarium TaxID=1233114 RepID=UPI002227F98B|nr:amidase [Azospirillum fermentarium]MCW2246569.1 aspartyl-tRNA(Asn)/glutamyl-tRNA(Gln) amidotransferase subunit A [Azospirillum fermentarium]
MSRLPTLASLADALASGQTTSTALVTQALDRIADPAGEGARAFTRVDRDAALAAAAASDALRAHGVVPSPLAGIPVSVKDLFDIRGQTTAAGSRLLRDAPPATADAAVVARLRAAGAVIVGRTAMTEFAFSGLGLNPHTGTPGNPFGRDRIPGGSSSGAAVSVADGMAAAAVGSDTGGSVRIPAAFCGLAGFKPTQARVPRDGAFPLSWTLDTVGPLGRSVACCALMDAVMAGEAPEVPEPAPVAGLRLAVPRCHALDGLDATVAAAFARALDRLSAAGARVVEIDGAVFDRIPQANARINFSTAEAYALHRPWLATRSGEYDPRVRARLERALLATAPDYVDLMRARQALMAQADALTRAYDAVVLPSVAVVAPRFDELTDDADYARINLLVLRNTSLFNFLDRPAVSVPVASDDLPVGLMLAGAMGGDHALLSLAQGIEAVVC